METVIAGGARIGGNLKSMRQLPSSGGALHCDRATRSLLGSRHHIYIFAWSGASSLRCSRLCWAVTGSLHSRLSTP